MGSDLKVDRTLSTDECPNKAIIGFCFDKINFRDPTRGLGVLETQ